MTPAPARHRQSTLAPVAARFCHRQSGAGVSSASASRITGETPAPLPAIARDHSLAPSRRAFTLVEILAVIAIIAILSAAVITIAPGVVEAQNRSVTRGYVDSLAAACEKFRDSNAFRQYPTYEGDATEDEQWRLAFYACLSGLKVLRGDDDKLRLVPHTEVTDEAGKTLLRRSFISEATLKFNQQGNKIAPEEQRYFVDAWENPIAYRNNIISGGEPGKSWVASKFYIISAGDKYHDPLDPVSDFFTGNMQQTGQIPNEYFSGDYRVDNITSWKRD